MEVFEQMGIIRILLLLFENKDTRFSKYELAKLAKLGYTTANDRLDVLKDMHLIEEHPQIGPRARTEITLTPLGEEVAQLFFKIKTQLNL